MRIVLSLVTLACVVVLAGPVLAQSATELKKELLPKIKRAQADGKDLGEAAEEYKQGDKALMDGLQDEAITHFKKSKELMPKE